MGCCGQTHSGGWGCSSLVDWGSVGLGAGRLDGWMVGANEDFARSVWVITSVSCQCGVRFVQLRIVWCMVRRHSTESGVILFHASSGFHVSSPDQNTARMKAARFFYVFHNPCAVQLNLPSKCHSSGGNTAELSSLQLDLCQKFIPLFCLLLFISSWMQSSAWLGRPATQ